MSETEIWEDSQIDKLHPSDRAFFLVMRDLPVDQLLRYLAAQHVTMQQITTQGGLWDEGAAREYVYITNLLEDKHAMTSEAIEIGIQQAAPLTLEEEMDLFEKRMKIISESGFLD